MSIKGLNLFIVSFFTSFWLSGCDVGPDGLSSGLEEAGQEYYSSSSSGTTMELTINGVAAKGLINGGVINIHPIINGVLNTQPYELESPVVTNTAGSYSVNIPDYDGNPFLVRLTTTETTTMKCDLSIGCGDDNNGNDIPFGGTVNIHDPTFNLDAIVPPPANDATSASVNISVLTDTAAEVALRDITNSGGTSSVNIAQLIRSANSRVANRLGIITSDVTTLPIVDLTDTSAVATVDDFTRRYNMMNAGVVEAMLNGNNTLSITQAVANFSNQYATDGGLADREESETTRVTLAEILTSTSSILDEVRTRDTENVLDLSALSSLIDANLTLAQNGSTEITDGEASDFSLTNLEKVKAMVGELRKIGMSVDEGFATEEALIEAALDDDAGVTLTALGMAAEAIGSAYEAYTDDNTLTTYTNAEHGITVSISADASIVTYSVDESVIVDESVSVSIAVSAVDEGSSIDSTTQGNTESVTATVDMLIAGTLASSMVSLEIDEGTLSLSALDGTIVDTESNGTTSETIDAAFDELTIDMSVVLRETSAASATPVTFSGNISLELGDVELDAVEQWGSANDPNFHSFMSSIDAQSVNVNVNGLFENTEDESVSATISLVSSLTDYDPEVEETETNYVDLSFTGIFTLSEFGEINMDTKVILSGIRTGLESASTKITVQYGAVAMVSDYDTDREQGETVVITDQNDVIMTLTDANDLISGNMTLDGMEYATISETDGLIVFSYIDGTNESI